MTLSQKIRNWFAAIVMVTSLGGSVAVIALPQASYAATSPCVTRFLTFPAWFRGLTDSNCDIKKPDSSKAGLSKFIWTIVLNVIEIILQLVGYASVAYIMYGGFKYLTSAGASDGIVKARKIITNAVVGLVLSIFSVAIVNVVAGALTQ
jgi:hypothetical protein